MATARPRTRGGNRPGSKGTRGFDRSRAKAWKYKKKAKKETEDEPTTTVADKPAPEPPASKPDKADACAITRACLLFKFSKFIVFAALLFSKAISCSAVKF